MALHELITHKGAGMESRFYCDGKRISREQFDMLEIRAEMHGRVSCMWTRGIEKPGGKTRRINGKTIQF